MYLIIIALKEAQYYYNNKGYHIYYTKQQVSHTIKLKFMSIQYDIDSHVPVVIIDNLQLSLLATQDN